MKIGSIYSTKNTNEYYIVVGENKDNTYIIYKLTTQQSLSNQVIQEYISQMIKDKIIDSSNVFITRNENELEKEIDGYLGICENRIVLDLNHKYQIKELNEQLKSLSEMFDYVTKCATPEYLQE